MEVKRQKTKMTDKRWQTTEYNSRRALLPVQRLLPLHAAIELAPGLGVGTSVEHQGRSCEHLEQQGQYQQIATWRLGVVGGNQMHALSCSDRGRGSEGVGKGGVVLPQHTSPTRHGQDYLYLRGRKEKRENRVTLHALYALQVWGLPYPHQPSCVHHKGRGEAQHAEEKVRATQGQGTGDEHGAAIHHHLEEGRK